LGSGKSLTDENTEKKAALKKGSNRGFKNEGRAEEFLGRNPVDG